MVQAISNSKPSAACDRGIQAADTDDATSVAHVTVHQREAALLFAMLNGVTFVPPSVLVAGYVARQSPPAVLGQVSNVRSFFSDAGRPLAMTASGVVLPLLGLGALAAALAGIVVSLGALG